VDIWSNHFNVYVAKGGRSLPHADYIEHTIRPRGDRQVRGPPDRHRQESRDAVLPRQLGERGARLRPPRPSASAPSSACRKGSTRTTPGAARAPHTRRRRRLHTAGRDRRRAHLHRLEHGTSPTGGDFEFHDWAHDRGEKQVLGVKFESGHDMDEGSGSSGFWPATRPRCTT